MLKTTLEQLEEVQAAISAALTNQSYRLGDRQITRADLQFLTIREETLLKRYGEESGTRPLSVAVRFGSLGYT
jgi:hypothetical protein